MTYPRLGTAAGNRAVSRCQQAYDNMVPDEDDSEPEEDEAEPTQVICTNYKSPCAVDCEHGHPHVREDGCGETMCADTKIVVHCMEVE
jgi:hypothetical protein